MKFGCNRPSSFRGEVVWNCGRTTDRRTTDGRRTTEPAYTISSPGAFGSGELKTFCEGQSLAPLLGHSFYLFLFWSSISVVSRCCNNLFLSSFLIHQRFYQWFVCCLWCFIDGLGNLHVDQMLTKCPNQCISRRRGLWGSKTTCS